MPIPSNATVTFTNARGWFTLRLPASWKEMDSRFATVFIDPEKTGPGANVDAFGYQINATNEPPTLPYIALQVSRSGGLTDEALNILTREDVRRNGVLLRLRGEGVRDADIEQCSYDPTRQLLRTDYRRTDPRRGEVRAIDCAFFVGRGCVTIACVAGEKEMDAAGPLFEEALRSLAIDPSLRARLGTHVTTQTRFAAFKLRIWMFGLIFVGMLAWHFIKIRGDRVMSDEI